MKTAEDILTKHFTTNLHRSPEYIKTMIENDCEYKEVIKCMHTYAEQCLREAAERAKTKKTGNSGSWYDASVDKESILSLIKDLK